MSRTLASKRRRRRLRRRVMVRKHQQEMARRNKRVAEVTARLMGLPPPIQRSSWRQTILNSKQMYGRFRITQEAMEDANAWAGFGTVHLEAVKQLSADIEQRSAAAIYNDALHVVVEP